MKMLGLALAACLVSEAAFALDGQLILSNKGMGLDAPVFFAGGPRDGQKVDGQYSIQLFQVTEGSETAVGPVIAFRTGSGAGYFPNTTISIPNFGAASGLATFRVKCFDTGTSFDTALTYRAISSDFIATVNVPPTPPVATAAFPLGVRLFAGIIPEPSTLALGALGAAGLWGARRKRD